MLIDTLWPAPAARQRLTNGFFFLVAALLALWLAGCSTPAPSPAAVTPASPTTAPAPPASPSPSPAASPSPSPSAASGVPAGASALVQQAVADAAQRTGVSSSAVRVVSVDEREWRDASLGCPRPGQMYAQVITPGYLIVLEAGGQRLEYHADTRQRVQLCQP